MIVDVVIVGADGDCDGDEVEDGREEEGGGRRERTDQSGGGNLNFIGGG